jgi:uncharacterized lipoprotein YddW (UPF0748 family)
MRVLVPAPGRLAPRRAVWLALTLAAGVLVSATYDAEAPPRQDDEVRALWVTRSSLASPESIAAMVESARAGLFNTLLVQVRARGDAYFNGGIEARATPLGRQHADFDPLQTVLTAAHAAGLRVHAWLNIGLVASAVDLPTERTHAVYSHPEWLMVPRALARQMTLLDPRSRLYLDKLARWVRSQSAEIEGLYLSPIPAGAADYVVEIVSDLAARYAIDGVHLDYARYPNDEFDFSREALAAFASEVIPTLPEADQRRLARLASAQPLAYVDALPDRWRDFRRERLTLLVRRLSEAVRSWRPDALMTAAVHPDANDAAARRLQDWPAWLEDGSVDVICPMAYATDVPTFTALLASARAGAGERPLWAGIGAYRLTSTQTIESIRIARRAGADGIVLFSYDSVAAGPKGTDYLAEVGQAVFAR